MFEATQEGLGRNASVHSIHGSLLAVGELLRLVEFFIHCYSACITTLFASYWRKFAFRIYFRARCHCFYNMGVVIRIIHSLYIHPLILILLIKTVFLRLRGQEYRRVYDVKI